MTSMETLEVENHIWVCDSKYLHLDTFGYYKSNTFKSPKNPVSNYCESPIYVQYRVN